MPKLEKPKPEISIHYISLKAPEKFRRFFYGIAPFGVAYSYVA
jgi:hypothetical protein